jgi:NADPH:quinone reductase-like Zn-dependent oxidoreductase
VLTLGSGGVSIIALQLAKAAGARVIATTHRRQGPSASGALIAGAVVNYRALPEWSTEVRRLTQGPISLLMSSSYSGKSRQRRVIR